MTTDHTRLTVIKLIMSGTVVMTGRRVMEDATIQDSGSIVACGEEICASLHEETRALRREMLEALYRTGGGHYGGCLSVIDLIWALFRFELTISLQPRSEVSRHRLILSKGHAALALYAALRRLGLLTQSLNEYAQFSSRLEGHPDMTTLEAIDFSTGSLGQGLSAGLGMAYGLRRFPSHVWVVLGDGECQEGQVWEAAMLAATLQLHNLHAIVDSNGFQEWGINATPGLPPPLPVPDLARKWSAFGWAVVECDGHDFCELEAAFSAAKSSTDRPSVIIAHTVKGKGVSVIEAHPRRFHCTTVTQTEHDSIIGRLS